MILEAPRFDTYHILEKVAAEPASRWYQAGFEILKRRTAKTLLREVAVLHKPGIDFTDLTETFIGELHSQTKDGGSQNTMELLKNSSPDERLAIYRKMCEAAGVAVPAIARGDNDSKQ